MHRGEDHPLLVPVEAVKPNIRRRFRHQQQRIDHGVTGHEDLPDHTGCFQVGFGLERRREMKGRDLGEEPAVGFLREGIQKIVGAQTGLHMTNRDLLVKRSQTSGKRRGGVALHQDQLRWIGLKVFPQPLQRSTGDMCQGLTGGHQIEILIRLEMEQIHHLAHHFAVLTGQDDTGLQCITGLKRPDDRSQLDRLRTRSQNDRDAGLFSHSIQTDRWSLRASTRREQ